MDIVRLATIHPFLSHFTIGGLPFALLGYTLGRARRSPEWTFVGDVGLFVTTLSALGTTAFGLLSNALVPWPGGLETWRWLHLGFGVGATVVLVATSLWRWRALRRADGGGRLPLAALGTAAVLVGAAGWIGGEILVFHSGMAVEAAASGAFSAPVPWLGPPDPPRHFLDAMRGVRAHWGAIQTRVGAMVVEHPSDEDFGRIAASARRLGALAEWMSDNAREGPTQVQIVSMAMVLGGAAQEIEDAAETKTLAPIARALGDATATCAECHEGTRSTP